MTSTSGEAGHPAPVWRDKADFLIAAHVSDGGPLQFEQLWARQIDERHFELCCVPFYLYDIALGDIVETDGDYTVIRVVEPSGRYVFRVWFGDADHVVHHTVAESLTEMGALLEWRSPRLLALDARDLDHARVIAAFLAEAEGKGGLHYETGRS